MATSHRLDAPAFVGKKTSTFRIQLSKQGTTISDVAEVFTVYIQSPVLAYVKPSPKSRPYLTTSELAEYRNGRTAHVSLIADPRLIGWEIREGNIVVSRSGRVGEAYWVDKRLDGVLVGDSFRVVAKNTEERFFLYAFLSSSIARDALSGSAYGSVVDHASLEQLRGFPIPEVSEDARKRISDRIAQALRDREAADDLLESARACVRSVNKLPLVESERESGFVHGYVSSSEVIDSIEGASEFRLESHFHNPAARRIIQSISTCPSGAKALGAVANDVLMVGRFKRNYVGAAYGTPFLSGRNVVQVRPTDLKYLSKSQTEGLEGMLIERGWTLVTCSGTLGRTCFVWKNFEGYAASQHILRVIPDERRADAGYLYAFLSSQYGYEQIIRFRHGSVIDEITDKQLKKVLIPLPKAVQQKEIGGMVRLAYEKRAEALKLEDEAQEILFKEVRTTSASFGR